MNIGGQVKFSCGGKYYEGFLTNTEVRYGSTEWETRMTVTVDYVREATTWPTPPAPAPPPEPPKPEPPRNTQRKLIL